MSNGRGEQDKLAALCWSMMGSSWHPMGAGAFGWTEGRVLTFGGTEQRKAWSGALHPFSGIDKGGQEWKLRKAISGFESSFLFRGLSFGWAIRTDVPACTCTGMKERFIFKEIRKGMSDANSFIHWKTGPCFLMLILYSCEKRMVSLRIKLLEGMMFVLKVLKSSRWFVCVIINQDGHCFLNNLVFVVCFNTSVPWFFSLWCREQCIHSAVPGLRSIDLWAFLSHKNSQMESPRSQSLQENSRESGRPQKPVSWVWTKCFNYEE